MIDLLTVAIYDGPAGRSGRSAGYRIRGYGPCGLLEFQPANAVV